MAKQWYDFSRDTYHFVKLLKQLQEPLVFKHVSDFDTNGIFYWLGSNAGFVVYMCIYACYHQEYS